MPSARLRGGPAAVVKSRRVIRAPTLALKATAVYRLAREFHRLGVPLIPRHAL